MKKNVLIIFLAVITLFSIIFAFIKADESEKMKIEAVEVSNQMMLEKERADELARIAEAKAAEALMAQAEANRAMEKYQECKEGK